MNALARLTKTRGLLLISQPFYGTLAMQLALVEAPDLTDTMATDGASLFFNPAFVLELAEIELIGVWVHELEHCARNHFARIGGRDLGMANEAADLAINPHIISMGFTLPKGVLIDARYVGMGFEEIYAIRAKEKATQQRQQEQGQSDGGQGAGQPSQGQGDAPKGQPDQSDTNGQPNGSNGAQNGQQGQQQGQDDTGAANGQPSPGNAQQGQPAAGHGIGGILAPKGGAAGAAEVVTKWQIATRQALAVAKAANAGNLPGYLQDLAAEISAPIADYRDLLGNWIDSRIATDYSFTTPNRRFIGSEIVYPGASIDGLEHVVFVIDSSGSMDKDTLNAAASDVVGALESGKIKRLTVIYADARVCSVETFEAGDDIELNPRGGGGTHFGPTFDWVRENADDATALVYLTDLEVGGQRARFGSEPNCPVLWAVHGDSRKYAKLASYVPFGEPVYIGRL